MGRKTTIAELVEAGRKGEKFAAVSCYDYTTARLATQAGVEMILVGDSAAQVILGYDSTLPATMDFMVAITAAVRRGGPDVSLAADMPFLSYQVSTAEAVKNAGRFVVEAGAELIKIEATRAHLDVVKAVSDAGMAVMAHIGIRPQSITRVGRFRAEGTVAEQAADLIKLAGQMLKAGASCLLLEGMAAEAARIITQRSAVPVLGCGSGPDCDGQILIISDILGLTAGPRPKFAKSYGNLAEATVEAVSRYANEVHKGKFPDEAHSYHLKPGQLEKLQKMLKNDCQHS